MYKKIQNILNVSKIVSVNVIHVLDLLLLLVLLPFMIWKWISARHHVIAILRAIIEVTLELIISIIFAGVSIFMTVFFIFEDVYCSKTHYANQEKYLHIMLPDNKDKNSRVIKSLKSEREEEYN